MVSSLGVIVTWLDVGKCFIFNKAFLQAMTVLRAFIFNIGWPGDFLAIVGKFCCNGGI